MVLLSVAPSSMMADDITTVYVRTQSGDIGVPLSELTEVKFPADGEISIVTTSGTTNYSVAQGLLSFRFDQNFSSVEKIPENEGGLRLIGRQLRSSIAGIDVYSLDGVLRKSGAGTVLDLDELVKGVYVARSGSLTTKIVLR